MVWFGWQRPHPSNFFYLLRQLKIDFGPFTCLALSISVGQFCYSNYYLPKNAIFPEFSDFSPIFWPNFCGNFPEFSEPKPVVADGIVAAARVHLIHFLGTQTPSTKFHTAYSVEPGPIDAVGFSFLFLYFIKINYGWICHSFPVNYLKFFKIFHPYNRYIDFWKKFWTFPFFWNLFFIRFS